MAELRDRPRLKMDQVVDACFLCIFPGRLYHVRVDVVALDVSFDVVFDEVVRLFHRVVPEFSRDHVFPVLGHEFPVHARGDVGRHHGRLDGKCATAAERIYQDAVAFPGCQHNQGCRQSLGDGRFAG